MVQLVGLALLDEHETPPVHVHWSNCQPVEGEGRLAVAEKLLPQIPELCPFVKVLPQAEIVPGVVAPGKVVGLVSKVTRLAVACSAAASTCSLVLSE